MPAAIPIAAAAIGAGASIYSANKASKKAGQPGSGGTVTNEPWAGLQPFMTGNNPWYPGGWDPNTPGLYPNAAAAFNRGPYAGPYIGEQSPYTQQGIEQLAGQAGDPNSLVNQAQGQLGRTIRGDYLDVGSNPYLKGAVEQALGLARTGVSQQFSGENYGSSANQEWLARVLSGTALPTYANAYQTERQNQLNALQQAPGLQAVNPALLLQAGGLQEGRQQAEIAAAQQEHYAPWTPLQNYAQILGAIQSPGGTQTSTLPSYYDPIGTGLGGLMAGAQFGNQLGGLFGQSSTAPTWPNYGLNYGIY